MSARASVAHAALSKSVVAVYRQVCRDVPKIMTMYQIEGYTVSEARHMILLNHFRTRRNVTDPRVIERMLAKARQEIEEVMQQWKQKTHIQAMLAPSLEGVQSDAVLDHNEFQKMYVCERDAALSGV